MSADWYGYCHKMPRETYSSRSFARHVNDCFIPVILDADENEAFIESVGISAFPSTVIVSPELDVIGRIRGFRDVDSMTKELQPFCSNKRRENADIRPAGSDRETARAVATEKVSAPAAFGGYCLVSMLDRREVTKGDDRFALEFRGRRLLFANKDHKQRFRTSPEIYWPLRDGDCPVATVHHDEKTGGDPTTAAIFQGRIVFFRSVNYRDRFARNPRGYQALSQEAQRASSE